METCIRDWSMSFFKVEPEPCFYMFHKTCTPLGPGIGHRSWNHYVRHITELWVKVRETANALQTPFGCYYFTWRLRWIAFKWKILFPCDHVILQFGKLGFHFLLNGLLLISRNGTGEVIGYCLHLGFSIQLKARVILVWDFQWVEYGPSRNHRQTFVKSVFNVGLQGIHIIAQQIFEHLIVILRSTHV